MGKVIDRAIPVFRAVNGVIDGPFTEMPVGTELTFGDSRLLSGRQYVAVMLPTGERGYVFADTKVLKIKRVLLKADAVPVHRDPDFASELLTTLAKGSVAYLLETLERGGKQWNKVRTAAGVEGHIETVTPVVVVPDPSRAVGRNYLWIALRWFAAALALAVLGSALGLRASGMCLMALVPLVQGVPFTTLGVWNLVGAPV